MNFSQSRPWRLFCQLTGRSGVDVSCTAYCIVAVVLSISLLVQQDVMALGVPSIEMFNLGILISIIPFALVQHHRLSLPGYFFLTAKPWALLPLALLFPLIFDINVPVSSVDIQYAALETIVLGYMVGLVFQFSMRLMESILDGGISVRAKKKHLSVTQRKFELEVSDEYLFNIAVHEIGHALLFSHPNVRSGFVKVEVCLDHEDFIGIGGGCHNRLKLKQSSDEESAFLFWRGLVMLAGEEARVSVFNQPRHSGYISDLSSWCYIMSDWLLLTEKPFSVVPSLERNAWRRICALEYREQKLLPLQAKQQSSLRRFFNANNSVLVDAAVMLSKTGELSHKEMLPFFERVVWIDDLVVPNCVAVTTNPQ